MKNKKQDYAEFVISEDDMKTPSSDGGMLQGLDLRARQTVNQVLELLPPRISSSVESLCRTRRDFPLWLSEIRIRRYGYSGILISGESIPISVTVTDRECQELFQRIIGSSMYSHRDTLAEGFVTLQGGVRVGIGGSASYESGRLVGVNAPTAFVFRLPTVPYVDAKELASRFVDSGGGMLIFSPPGGGKTTLIRSLARQIGKCGGQGCVVVDERCEFIESDYADTGVDILRGYKKAEGIGIAVRTLCAGTVVIDEITVDADCSAIRSISRLGVPIIATVHAGNISELAGRAELRQLLEEGVFKTLVGIEGRSFERTVYSVREILPKLTDASLIL
jgi:stage III sporulation protein AA